MFMLPPQICTACWAPGYQYLHSRCNVVSYNRGRRWNQPFRWRWWKLRPLSRVITALGPPKENRPPTPSIPARSALALWPMTFTTNPTATDWFLLGYGGTFVTPAGGGTLLMVIVDTFYPNNTGGYTVTIDQAAVPEPAAVWLAFSGFALLGLPRSFRRFTRKG